MSLGRAAKISLNNENNQWLSCNLFAAAGPCLTLGRKKKVRGEGFADVNKDPVRLGHWFDLAPLVSTKTPTVIILQSAFRSPHRSLANILSFTQSCSLLNTDRVYSVIYDDRDIVQTMRFNSSHGWRKEWRLQ